MAELKEPVSTSEIIGGMRKGISPDKPGIYYSFFKEAITQAENDIRHFKSMMYDKYGESRRDYLEKTPPGAEKELAHELGARVTRLYSIAHRHLINQGLLVPRGEWEKYRGQHIRVGLTPEEHKLEERGEL